MHEHDTLQLSELVSIVFFYFFFNVDEATNPRVIEATDQVEGEPF